MKTPCGLGPVECVAAGAGCDACVATTCAKCNGSGEGTFGRKKCDACRGSGVERDGRQDGLFPDDGLGEE